MSPTPDATEENPYRSPEKVSVSPGDKKPRISLFRRIFRIALGLVLVPIAALIAGFCCCTGSLAVLLPFNPKGDWPAFVMIGSFVIGALAASGGVIHGLRRFTR